MPYNIWHGTETEGAELVAAINRNCTCQYTPQGVRLSTCGVHTAFVTDQRWLDDMLFMRRIRDHLNAQEHGPNGCP